MRTRTTAAGAIVLAAAFVGLVAAPAFAAEGSFTSKISQGRASFSSRTWTDRNLTSDHTVVTLGSCKANAGGGTPGSAPVGNVEVALIGKKGVAGTISKPCGTYDFGRVQADDYVFQLVSINGHHYPDRYFLDCSVKVAY